MNILSADAYSISSDSFASKECKEFSTYNLTHRYSPEKNFPDLAKDSRIVTSGLNMAIEYLSNPITLEDIQQAKGFMSRAHSFGGGLPFNENLWMRVLNEYDGYLPLTIYSVPDGTTVFPNEPVLTVTAMNGFGELAAHIEARLLGTISKATAMATICRHWFERLREQVKTDLDLLKLDYAVSIDDIARWQIHNFGSRACSSEFESTLMGLAHLQSFNGTDNFDAAFKAWKSGCSPEIGTSIPALGHRNILGYNNEVDCFKAIADSTSGDNVRICSLVADCYNYADAVTSIVSEAKLHPEVTYVVRPDSGDAYEVIREVYNQCEEAGVYTEVNGYKLPKNVKVIYGDSVTPKSQFEFMRRLREMRVLPTQWMIVGVGGYLVNNSTRDALSSAYKLCSRNYKPVVKLSETISKMSVPDITEVIRYDDFTGQPTIFSADDCYSDGHSIMSCVYHNGQVDNLKKFQDVRDLTTKTFDELSQFCVNNPKHGLNREVLSQPLQNIQNETFNKYRNKQ